MGESGPDTCSEKGLFFLSLVLSASCLFYPSLPGVSILPEAEEAKKEMYKTEREGDMVQGSKWSPGGPPLGYRTAGLGNPAETQLTLGSFSSTIVKN